MASVTPDYKEYDVSHLRLIVVLLALMITWLPSPAEAQAYDIVILGGTVIDGTGADGF